MTSLSTNRALDTSDPTPGSGAMFDQIAPRYDLLNRLMSLGLDKGWRRRMVRALLRDCRAGDTVLDLATGTADVALALARARPELGLRVVGVDPSANMLEVGRQKVAAANLADRIQLEQGDAQKLDFADGTFAAAGIAFGIRNVPDRKRGLREMARVVRPGGRVVILELSEPPSGWLGALPRLYVHRVVPWVGGLLSGKEAYRYLQRSIAAFPPAPEFCRVMEQAGLREVRAEAIAGGVAHLYGGRVE